MFFVLGRSLLFPNVPKKDWKKHKPRCATSPASLKLKEVNDMKKMIEK